MAQSREKNDRLPIFRENLYKLMGDMSITEFAGKVGLSRQTMGFYLNGDRIPDSLTLAQICKACGVSSDWLIGLTGDPAPRPCAVDELGLSNLAIESLKRYTKEQKWGLSRLIEHQLFILVCDRLSQYAKIPDSDKSELTRDDYVVRYFEFEERAHELENILASGQADLEGKVKVLIGYKYSDFLRKEIVGSFEQVLSFFDESKIQRSGETG